MLYNFVYNWERRFSLTDSFITNQNMQYCAISAKSVGRPVYFIIDTLQRLFHLWTIRGGGAYSFKLKCLWHPIVSNGECFIATANQSYARKIVNSAAYLSLAVSMKHSLLLNPHFYYAPRDVIDTSDQRFKVYNNFYNILIFLFTFIIS